LLELGAALEHQERPKYLFQDIDAITFEATVLVELTSI
jgi:predicted metal-binding protein